MATEARRLEAVNAARIEGLIEPILFGDPGRMRKLAQELGIRVENLDLRPARNPEKVKFPSLTLAVVLAERPPLVSAWTLDPSEAERPARPSSYPGPPSVWRAAASPPPPRPPPDPGPVEARVRREGPGRHGASPSRPGPRYRPRLENPRGGRAHTNTTVLFS